MSGIDEVMGELESIGVFGKVLMLNPKPQPAVEAVEVAEEEEVDLEDEESEEPDVAQMEALRMEKIATLSLKADEKLAAVIEAVQDLRGVFQELHEATKGEPDAEISEAS